MALEYDEKGKYYTDVIKKDVVLSQIQTNLHRIKGYLHIRVGERFSDEINRDSTFIAITNAEISNLDGEVIYFTEFLAVNRNQIIWMMPLKEV
jgi:hypothetical protein